jgi:hypothetical protein
VRALRCARAKGLIARRRAGLSAAERIRLEEHLTGCAVCCEEARALDAFAQLIDVEAAGNRPSRHARAITRVLNAASVAELPAPTSSPRAAPYLLAGAMAAASVLGLLAYRAGWGGPAVEVPGPLAQSLEQVEAPAPEHPTELVHDLVALDQELRARLDAGDLRADGVALAPGAAVRSGASLETERGAGLVLGPALVELAAGGRALWDLERTTLRLDEGVVRAHVEPGQGEIFRVATDRFVVEVLGTEFEVTRDGVTVETGLVRVTDLEGAVLAVSVEGGESWRWNDPAREAPRVAPTVDVSETLARARSRLAQGNVPGARALIREALGANPSRVERAEAETLLAECALVSGDRARAAQRYLAVAESYARLSAGENALFAAARLERDLGRNARAAELFDLYLTRYPNGRFRADAQLRLEEALAR